MGAYIARRLLLLFPTLIGITLLVFLMVAYAGGGIGAALRAAGGQMDAGSRAAQEAYLEDRYGLDDPKLVQYFRWLGRVSPLKFGTRAQITPEGETVTSPKTLDPPVVWNWFADSLPTPKPADPIVWPTTEQLELEPDQSPANALAAFKSSTFRRANANYIRDRGRFVAARALYEEALRDHATAIGHTRVVTRERKLDKSRVHRLTPDKDHPTWQRVVDTGNTALAAYQNALNAREQLRVVFEARPYPQAGVPIIPGVMHVAVPDLGRSFSKGQPVARLIGERLPVTLLLNLIAIPIIYFIAIPSGMLAAIRQGQFADTFLGVLYVGLWSVPIVWFGVLAVGFVANNEYLGWFPVAGIRSADADLMLFLPSWNEAGQFQRGYLLDTLWHITLPVIALVYGGFAVLSKQTRAAMLDNFNADYVRTAKAKGVPAKDIVFRHVFRNSLLPIITIFVSIFPSMLAGSVVIEQIFTVPGMGRLIIESIYLRDREVILANVLIIAIVNILALLLADILYAVADPRISYN